MLVRYLVTGTYVGVATVCGYIWWMCFNKEGPMMRFTQLVRHLECDKNTQFANGYKCDVFKSVRPTTLALSTLVTIEMFNALNAVTETKSLLTMSPFSNGWLIAAVIGSFLQHILVLSWPTAEIVFRVTTLNLFEVKSHNTTHNTYIAHNTHNTQSQRGKVLLPPTPLSHYPSQSRLNHVKVRAPSQ